MSSRAELERFYRQYGHVVVRRGRRLLGSEADGQELLHDVFTALLAGGEPKGPIDQPVAWLYAIATRKALSRLRDGKNRARLLADELAPRLDATATTEPARAHEVAQLLVGLPEDEIAAVVHFHVDEMTHDEIAAALRCSRRHVGNLLTRGRNALRAAATTEEAP
jgi:RNA polymerase sigma factor (sigma-70 family)